MPYRPATTSTLATIAAAFVLAACADPTPTADMTATCTEPAYISSDIPIA